MKDSGAWRVCERTPRHITGETSVPATHYYRNFHNSTEFPHISGGIGLPGKEKPGGAFIIAVDRAVDDSEPTFHVFDMAEDRNLADPYRMHFGLKA